jgi:cobalt/nickel transport system permease protein
MKALDESFFDLRHLDDLSRNNTLIHRIDPRVKVITTFIYIIFIVSFDKYEVSSIVPFALYPVILLSIGNIPILTIIKKMILVSPFAIFIGIFNPFIDKTPVLEIGNLVVSGGAVSFISIMLRFALTVSTALILISVTGFNQICRALEKLGIPKIFVIQLMFLYRYIYVLGEELVRMNRARILRSVINTNIRFTVYKNIIGCLLIRTLDRAQRIHLAMSCRGFDGTIHVVNPIKIHLSSILFLIIWLGFFIILRIVNVPQFLGLYYLELFI